MTTQELVERLEAMSSALDACGTVNAAIYMRKAASRLSEMDAALRAQEWQDIETAPREEVLLYFPRIVTGAHRQSVLSEMYRIGRVSDTPNRRPTHWRPLPAGPVHDKGEPQP